MARTNTSTLWKRPENGTYYFRKGVPERLRPLIGKGMLQISLGTKELALAISKHRVVAADVAAQWAALDKPEPKAVEERPLVTVSKKDILALSGEMYQRLLKERDRDPGSAVEWKKALVRIQKALPIADRRRDMPSITFGGAMGIQQMAVILCGPEVKAFLFDKGIALTLEDERRLCIQAAKALSQAYEVLLRRVENDWSPDPRASRFPPPISFTGWRQWYPDYCSSRLPEPSSRKRQEGVLTAFFEFLGHDIPARVTDDDAIRWVDARLKVVSHGTVRNADLAHPRSFFTWAKRTKRLPLNPFADVVVDAVAKKVQGGKIVPIGAKREYHLGEAVKILAATLEPARGRLSLHSRAARRWVPWICAYSGARVGEIAQLRKDDVYQSLSLDEKQLIWVIRITPEAGRVKDHEEREVAIHPHLMEQGFIEFAKSSPTDTLFYDPRRSRGGSNANPQSASASKGIARWIREDLKITDPNISPNHSWRHRFRSLLKGKVFPEILDGIDGHAPASVGHKYGKVWPEVSLAAVSLIEPYQFGGRELPDEPASHSAVTPVEATAVGRDVHG